MESLASALVVLACSIWIGAIVFQALVVAPAAFSTLDEPGAGKLLRKIFPRFFGLGIVCGIVLIAALIALGQLAQWPGEVRWLLAIGFAMLAANTACLRLVPLVNAARDAGQAGMRRFKQLHATTVFLTLLVLVLGSVFLVALVLTGQSV